MREMERPRPCERITKRFKGTGKMLVASGKNEALLPLKTTYFGGVGV